MIFVPNINLLQEIDNGPSMHEQIEFESVKYNTIYVGVETNILAVDDRIDDLRAFY